MTQFDASLFRSETPHYPTTLGIAGGTPSCEFGVERGHIWDAAVQALLTQHAQFNLCHIQPAAVAGGVMELQAPGQTVSLLGRKSFIERGQMMSVEIVTHQFDLTGVRILLLQELANLLGPVHPRALLVTPDPPP